MDLLQVQVLFDPIDFGLFYSGSFHAFFRVVKFLLVRSTLVYNIITHHFYSFHCFSQKKAFVYSSMRPFYLTTTRPRHRYKGEGPFMLFRKARASSNFGRLEGRQPSFLWKMMVIQKIFNWYYGIPSRNLLKKIMNPEKRNRSFGLRRLLAFFYILEQNSTVVLVRASFLRNFRAAQAAVRLGFVFVDGCQQRNPISLAKPGTIIELLSIAYFALLIKRPLFSFVRILRRFRLNYIARPPYLLFFQSSRFAQGVISRVKAFSLRLWIQPVLL